MSAEGPWFIDSNVLLYLMSRDEQKADRVETLLASGGVISVQVLNEIASVASRKFGMSWRRIRDFLGGVSALCEVLPLTVEIHEGALALAQQHRFSFYDASIVAAALQAGCRTLWSEDMQHGRRLQASDGQRMLISNPFIDA